MSRLLSVQTEGGEASQERRQEDECSGKRLPIGLILRLVTTSKDLRRIAQDQCDPLRIERRSQRPPAHRCCIHIPVVKRLRRNESRGCGSRLWGATMHLPRQPHKGGKNLPMQYEADEDRPQSDQQRSHVHRRRIQCLDQRPCSVRGTLLMHQKGVHRGQN